MMDSESDDLVLNEGETAKLMPRAEAAYPGNGYTAKGDVRRRGPDGIVKTKSGFTYCIPTKALLEFIGTMFFFFFATLGSVNSSAVAVAMTNPGSVTFSNSTGATIAYTTVDHTAFVANPLATFLSALVWGGCLFLVLRALPGIAVNPFVVMNHWFFQWKDDGEPLPIDHIVHSLTESIMLVAAQFAGGLAAIVMVYFVQGRDTGLLGEPLPSAAIGHEAWIILYEAAACFLFMTLINVYSRPRRDVNAHEQAMFIGAVLFFIVMGFGGYTGAALNPVHTLAPALVRSIFSGVALRTNVVYYLMGQAIGFTLAGIFAWFINSRTNLHRFRAVTTVQKEL